MLFFSKYLKAVCWKNSGIKLKGNKELQFIYNFKTRKLQIKIQINSLIVSSCIIYNFKSRLLSDHKMIAVIPSLLMYYIENDTICLVRHCFFRVWKQPLYENAISFTMSGIPK